MEIPLFLAVLFLSATNGANDNFKGVAMLYGSRRAGYWTSLLWASAATFAGSICSVLLANGLLRAFSGAGLVPQNVAAEAGFAFGVAGGAALTVGLAAWRGLPISTTHAIIGALCGTGLVAVGTDVNFATLGRVFLLPLLVGPLIAVIPACVLAYLFRFLASDTDALGWAMRVLSPQSLVTPEGVVFRQAITKGYRFYPPVRGGSVTSKRFRGLQTADVPLFLLGGFVSFARGLNDTPKIAALLLPIATLGGNKSIAVTAVGIAMLIGGVLGARRVARTLSDKITELDVAAALSAGMVTSLLVGTASYSGLPVSTTHVSVGALAGTGLVGGNGVDRRVMTNIVLSWVITLPAGALFGAILYGVIS